MNIAKYHLEHGSMTLPERFDVLSIHPGGNGELPFIWVRTPTPYSTDYRSVRTYLGQHTHPGVGWMYLGVVGERHYYTENRDQ